MSEEARQEVQHLKQSVLDRIDAARNAVEELSEEELESIVGSGSGPARSPGAVYSTTMAVPEEPLSSLSSSLPSWKGPKLK